MNWSTQRETELITFKWRLVPAEFVVFPFRRIEPGVTEELESGSVHLIGPRAGNRREYPSGRPSVLRAVSVRQHAELAHRIGHEALDRFLGGHVGANVDRRRLALGNRAAVEHIGDHDLGPGLRQSLAERRPDAARAAGYDRDLILEPAVHVSSLLYRHVTNSMALRQAPPRTAARLVGLPRAKQDGRKSRESHGR